MPFLYSLMLAALILLSYLCSFLLFGTIPLPNIHHTGDLFMDFWNIVYQAELGQPYSDGSFYHPLSFLILGSIDFVLSTNAVSLRYYNSHITVLLICIILFCSAINYFALAGKKFSPSTIFVCFLSAPFLFLISRLNLILFVYLLVTLYFSVRTRESHLLVSGIVWPFAAILKPYLVLFPFFNSKNLRQVNLVLCVLGAVSLFSIVVYNFPLLNHSNTKALSVTGYIANLFTFAIGNPLTVYEKLALNYSPFVYSVLVKKLSFVSPSIPLIYLNDLITLTNLLAVGFFLGVCAKVLRNYSERESFLLFILSLATIFPNIGGYVMVLSIPLLNELRGFLKSTFVPIAALMYCPVDFTLVFADSLIYSNPIWPEAGDLNGMGSSQTGKVMPALVQNGILRRDLSLLGLVRPLALVAFWYVFFKNVRIRHENCVG